MILRWRVQGMVAGFWWAGAVAMFLCRTPGPISVIFLIEMCFGIIAFGVYAMMLERRGGGWGAGMPVEGLPELDPVIHGKVRLAVLSLLLAVEEAEFTWLREKTGTTDGNLGAQMLKLEEAGYVAMEKRFAGRKPQTLYRMTQTGREALRRYVAALKSLLGGSIDLGRIWMGSLRHGS